MKLCPVCSFLFEDQDACPECGAPYQAGRRPTAARIAPPRRQKIPARLRLGVAVDATGSSAPFAAGIRRTLALILDAVDAKAASVGVWLWEHRDEEEGELPVLVSEGVSAAQAIADVARIEFQGGGDAPETHADGVLNVLRRTPWVCNPRVGRDVLIAFTTDETKPLRDGRPLEALGREIAERKVLYYHVGEHTPGLERLRAAARGMSIRLSNTPDVAECQAVAACCAKSILLKAQSGSATAPLAAPGRKP